MNSVNSWVIPEEIIKDLSNLISSSKDLVDLPFENIEGLRLKFINFLTVSDAKKSLNKNDGIICFNYDIDNQLNLSHQYLLSASIFHLINATFFIPTIDSKNRTPFTIFKSIAHGNSEKAYYLNSPEKKLGYHNDLFVKNGKYYLPKYVSLINLYIGYKKGGNFYYVNKNKWDFFNYFFENGRTKLFSYEAPPLVYESMANMSSTEKKTNIRQIPAFWEENGERYVFFNDSLILVNDPEFVVHLNDSLVNNSFVVEIPQKINQVILFRNDLGFHSRDIFREPLIHKGINRLFLRSVSNESVLFPE